MTAGAGYTSRVLILQQTSENQPRAMAPCVYRQVLTQDLLLYVVGSTSSPPAAHKLLLSGSRLAVRDLLEGAGLLDGQVGWCGSP